METIRNLISDEERALYGSRDLEAVSCRFEGPADGESAFKESRNIIARDCFFDLRYPFWHDHGLKIEDCEMTKLCRAALWYSEDVSISNSKLHGIKALRECSRVSMTGCDVDSPEFGWSVTDLKLVDCSITSEYFLMNSRKIVLDKVRLEGKYSFQYTQEGTVSNCFFNTKDAFWHAKNITIRDCEINGEYIGWYSENLTFINCTIKGTQPFCYCRGLKLIDCRMEDCDLAFEKSEAEGVILSDLISIKNFYSGKLTVNSVEEVINDDPLAEGKIEIRQ
ncbi:MAG: DUF3737 family protein [Saccharofermentans sp.]|nr:DUF3737 family protein [Saccharofermentans sp.]